MQVDPLSWNNIKSYMIDSPTYTITNLILRELENINTLKGRDVYFWINEYDTISIPFYTFQITMDEGVNDGPVRIVYENYPEVVVIEGNRVNENNVFRFVQHIMKNEEMLYDEDYFNRIMSYYEQEYTYNNHLVDTIPPIQFVNEDDLKIFKRMVLYSLNNSSIGGGTRYFSRGMFFFSTYKVEEINDEEEKYIEIDIKRIENGVFEPFFYHRIYKNDEYNP